MELNNETSSLSSFVTLSVRRHFFYIQILSLLLHFGMCSERRSGLPSRSHPVSLIHAGVPAPSDRSSHAREVSLARGLCGRRNAVQYADVCACVRCIRTQTVRPENDDSVNISPPEWKPVIIVMPCGKSLLSIESGNAIIEGERKGQRRRRLTNLTCGPLGREITPLPGAA